MSLERNARLTNTVAGLLTTRPFSCRHFPTLALPSSKRTSVALALVDGVIVCELLAVFAWHSWYDKLLLLLDSNTGFCNALVGDRYIDDLLSSLGKERASKVVELGRTATNYVLKLVQVLSRLLVPLSGLY